MKMITATLAFALLATTAHAESALTRIDDLQRGSLVSVAGIVERITDEDEFYLGDESGRVLVYIGANRLPLTLGEAVTVHGVVDDDPGPLEIYARSITRADGTAITLKMRHD